MTPPLPSAHETRSTTSLKVSKTQSDAEIAEPLRKKATLALKRKGHRMHVGMRREVK